LSSAILICQGFNSCPYVPKGFRAPGLAAKKCRAPGHRTTGVLWLWAPQGKKLRLQGFLVIMWHPY